LRRGSGGLGSPLGRRGLLSHLLEILLNVLLKRDRHLVAIDLSAGFAVRRLVIGVRCAKLLLRGIYFDGHFAGHVRGAFADNLTDLAHRGELLGQLGVLGAILFADAASRIMGRLLVGALAAALAFGALAAIGFVAELTVLRIGGLFTRLLLPLSHPALLVPFGLLRLLLRAVLSLRGLRIRS